MLPWSFILIDSTPPILSEYANSFAPVPEDTFVCTIVPVVDVVPPVISSFTWKTPVLVESLLITSLLFCVSILDITPVALLVPPVTTSFTSNPETSLR